MTDDHDRLGHMVGDARKRYAPQPADTCQTPGCGHAKSLHHNSMGACVRVNPRCGCVRYTASECTCPPDEFLSPSDCALHGDDAPNQFRHSNGEELGVPDNLTAPTETVDEDEDYPWASQILSQKIAEKFDQQPTREQVLADAEAAWEKDSHHVIKDGEKFYAAHACFIAGYLAGKGIAE